MAITVTANQLISRALVDLRVLGIGRTVTKAHTDVAFPYLQEIVDSWKTNRWSVFRVVRERFKLIAGQADYTLGPGGTLLVKGTTASLPFKPRWLTSATANQSGEDYEYPVRIWTRQEWLYQRQKARSDERPRAIYMEPHAILSAVHLWPVPESASYDLILGLPETFEAFDNLTSEVALQDGYHLALRTALRNKIGTPFGKPASMEQIIEAKEAFGMIADQNDDGPPVLAANPLNEAVSGGGLGGSYDGYSDTSY